MSMKILTEVLALGMVVLAGAAAIAGEPNEVPEEGINAELDASQRAFLEAQQSEAAQSDPPPILSPSQKRARRSAFQQARLETMRNAKQLALEKAQLSQRPQAAESAGAAPEIGAPESSTLPQTQAISAVSPASPAPGPLPAPTRSPAALAGISISFHLDEPSASKSRMADHWVPRISGVLEREFTVLAKAEAHDAAGRILDVEPEWTAADPSTVAVSPAKGRTVKITVRGAGASNLTVAAAGLSKDLWISAAPDQSNAMTVEILQ
jgi:hypothetical protein